MNAPDWSALPSLLASAGSRSVGYNWSIIKKEVHSVMSKVKNIPTSGYQDKRPLFSHKDVQVLYRRFHLALDSVATAHNEGHITSEEMDILVRDIVAGLIAFKLDAMVYTPLMSGTRVSQTLGKDVSPIH